MSMSFSMDESSLAKVVNKIIAFLSSVVSIGSGIKGSIKNGQSTDLRNIENTRHKTNKRERKSKGQSRMDNPQTSATFRTQDTRQINVRENQRVNKEWKIHIHWQH